MKWTEEKIKAEIHNLANKLNIEVMPTNTQMRENRMSGLSRAIGENGGTAYWAEKSGLPMRKRKKKWTDDVIEKELASVVKSLRINTMPSSGDLISLGRLDLQVAISKNGGFRYWAEKLKLDKKESASNKGLDYEDKAKLELIERGFKVDAMTNGHPYDLLVNGNVKVDVKVSSPHYYRGDRNHTFRPSSKYSTCDIYICYALDDDNSVERLFVIPSKFLKVQTLCIGKDSKYNSFINKWDYIKKYSDFYESIKNSVG